MRERGNFVFRYEQWTALSCVTGEVHNSGEVPSGTNDPIGLPGRRGRDAHAYLWHRHRVFRGCACGQRSEWACSSRDFFRHSGGSGEPQKPGWMPPSAAVAAGWKRPRQYLLRVIQRGLTTDHGVCKLPPGAEPFPLTEDRGGLPPVQRSVPPGMGACFRWPVHFLCSVAQGKRTFRDWTARFRQMEPENTIDPIHDL
jgi:hypothetical protein